MLRVRSGTDMIRAPLTSLNAVLDALCYLNNLSPHMCVYEYIINVDICV
jgi:hypothetical protein